MHVAMTFELNLKNLAEDAQGVVLGVERTVDDGGNHPLGSCLTSACWSTLLPVMPRRAGSSLLWRAVLLFPRGRFTFIDQAGLGHNTFSAEALAPRQSSGYRV